jgi:hypothetical protein
MELNTAEILSRALKYLLEGLAVGLACFFTSKLPINEIIIIAITAAATFAILDMYTPQISDAARLGTGFGIGTKFAGLKFA